MTSPPKYPLEQVLDLKKKRVEDAERVVLQRVKELEAEEEKLHQVEKERDKVKLHLNEKLLQLRTTLDQGTTSSEILQMKVYIKVVEEELEQANEKVNNQKKQVEAAEKRLEEAKEDVRQKRKEVDKLNLHKKEWQKEVDKEIAVAEQKEQDELGTISFFKHFKE